MTLCDKCFSDRMSFYRDPVTRRQSSDRLFCYKCGHIQSVLTEGGDRTPSKIIVAILRAKDIISATYTGNVVFQLNKGGIAQIGIIEYKQEFAD